MEKSYIDRFRAIAISEEMKKELGLVTGDSVELEIVDGELRITKAEDALDLILLKSLNSNVIPLESSFINKIAEVHVSIDGLGYSISMERNSSYDSFDRGGRK